VKNIKKLFLALFVITLCFSTKVFASEFEIKDYKIEANVNDDGSLNVVEYLKYYFDEDMNGLLRDIMYKYNFNNQKNDMYPTSSRYQASDVKNIRVFTSDTSFDNMSESSEKSQSELSNGMSGVYSVSKTSNNTIRIKTYSPVSSESYKYVKYEYTIDDVVVNYNDYAELFWNFVGKDWECDINNLDIQITIPAYEDIKVFGHTYADMNLLNVNGNKINIKVSNLSEGTAVDSRVIFHNTYLGNLCRIISTLYHIRLEAVPLFLSAPSLLPAILNEVHGLPCVKISKSGKSLGLIVVISHPFIVSGISCITENAVLAYSSISQYPTISSGIFNSFIADENVPLPANASYIFNLFIIYHSNILYYYSCVSKSPSGYSPITTSLIPKSFITLLQLSQQYVCPIKYNVAPSALSYAS
jgi:hypothetical protein